MASLTITIGFQTDRLVYSLRLDDAEFDHGELGFPSPDSIAGFGVQLVYRGIRFKDSGKAEISGHVLGNAMGLQREILALPDPYGEDAKRLARQVAEHIYGLCMAADGQAGDHGISIALGKMRMK